MTKKNEPVVENFNTDREVISNHAPEVDKKVETQTNGDRGDDSDYYTPEDPAPMILSPLYESDKVREIGNRVF